MTSYDLLKDFFKRLSQHENQIEKFKSNHYLEQKKKRYAQVAT